MKPFFVFVLVFFLALPAHAGSRDQDDIVIIPEYMKACTQDSDCFEVSISCSGCGEYGAVNKNFQNEFHKYTTERCKPYFEKIGSMKICSDLRAPSTIECVDGKCKSTPFSVSKPLKQH